MAVGGHGSPLDPSLRWQHFQMDSLTLGGGVEGEKEKSYSPLSICYPVLQQKLCVMQRKRENLLHSRLLPHFKLLFPFRTKLIWGTDPGFMWGGGERARQGMSLKNFHV